MDITKQGGEINLEDVQVLVKAFSRLFKQSRYSGKVQPSYDGGNITHVKFEFVLNAKEIREFTSKH